MFSSLFLPSFDWIQIEVSGLCNAHCVYCPHTVFRNRWKGHNLSLDTFTALLSYFKKTKLVYLQGWGKPLLNPKFFEMVRLAKAQGAKVVFTTNGTFIDEHVAEELVGREVDIIALSIAAIEHNDRLRKGTSLLQVLKAIEMINLAKERLKKNKPNIHIAYMLLKSNEPELERLPKFLKGLRVKEVVVSLLDFVPNETLKDEYLTQKSEEEFISFRSRAEKIAKEVEPLGIRLVFNLPSPSFQRRRCTENPVRSLFINSLGMVSPCVFKGIPADLRENLYFGSLKEESLKKIWNKKEYQKFREIHSSPSKPTFCKACPKVRVIEVGGLNLS